MIPGNVAKGCTDARRECTIAGGSGRSWRDHVQRYRPVIRAQFGPLLARQSDIWLQSALTAP